MRFLLGGYTAEMDGVATGIGVLHAGAVDDALAGGSLATVADAVEAPGSPSWIGAHPTLDVVYAALEGRGQVQAFRRTGEESFVALGEPVDAGEALCHVTVDPGGRWLIASCWGDGRVVRMALDGAGVPSSPTIAPAAIDPYADRGMVLDDSALVDASSPDHAVDGGADGAIDADGAPAVRAAARPSRAHQARFVPGGLLVTTDMGLDQVRLWRNSERGLVEAGRVVLPFGSGPRHTVWHPSGHLYVVTELSHEVFVLAPDPSRSSRTDAGWRIVGGAPVSPATQAGVDTAAEIALSRTGEFVTVGVRGSNTIATLRVRGEGTELSPVALVEAGVDWPRHHVVERDTLLVAGQLSNDVASLALDERTGVPGRVRHRVTAPSPTCLLPLR